MSSSNRPRRRGALHVARGDAAAWQPAELEELDVFAAGGPDGDFGDLSRGTALQDGPEPAAADGADHGAEAEVPTGPDPVELQLQMDNAYARGHEDGRAEGAAEEAARLSSVIQALERSAAAFEASRPKWLDALEKNLVALSAAVAREVIGRELKGQADDIATLVHQAISEFPLDAAIRVRLNPADLSAISSPLRGDALRAGREVRWVPDPSIAPGGCLVEGPESLVDGRIEKALERIYSRLIYHD